MANPKTVFLDADALIALQFHNHPNYDRAVAIAKKIGELELQVFPCTYVMLEVATVINRHFEEKRGPEVVKEIMANPHIHLLTGDSFLEKGLEKMNQQSSKNVSLNDCVYFALVDQLGIDAVFSFDKHWKNNGYSILN